MKASLRGVAPLFIVDPFECGGSNWGAYLDELARIEAQQDKAKDQRDAEVGAVMVKSMPQVSLPSVFSSHPPIHDRIVRLRGLLQEPSEEPAEMPADIQARRRAAAKVVTEVTQNNPEVAAAFVGALLKANPGEQLRREFAENSPLSGLILTPPPEAEQTYTDPSEQAEYQKLYEYNLGSPAIRRHRQRDRYPTSIPGRGAKNDRSCSATGPSGEGIRSRAKESHHGVGKRRRH